MTEIVILSSCLFIAGIMVWLYELDSENLSALTTVLQIITLIMLLLNTLGAVMLHNRLDTLLGQ